MVGWDHGCRLAPERNVSYRTGIAEEQASVDTSIAGGWGQGERKSNMNISIRKLGDP